MLDNLVMNYSLLHGYILQKLQWNRAITEWSLLSDRYLVP